MARRPRHWVPFGLTETKPRHYRDMLRIAWRNRDDLGHAWRVLTRGVCDGCALGTSGLRDWTIPGIHLCMVRLELLRLNTMGPMDHRRLEDLESLRGLDSKQLRDLGRLAYPMRRRAGEPGFTRIGWDEAWEGIGRRWRAAEPERTAMYLTSRGLTNETYYVGQKVMRFLGSPNVENSARLCHSPSTAGLKRTVGVAATTCSYRDWYDADLVVFFGSNPANDQPLTTKYLHEAKKRGTRVVEVNAMREPGMERYWVPSTPSSALFGTAIVDRSFRVRIGGDLALLTAVMKRLVQRDAVAADFLAEAVEGWDEFRDALALESFADLCDLAGMPVSEVVALAEELERAERAVLVWSMGITQHVHGSDTVAAIASLALLREWVGRPGCGLMPIRGHSGVQGGAEMGAYATALPGGLAVTPENAARFSELWGFPVPDHPGLTTTETLAAARRGALEAWWCSGGNFLETLPDPAGVAAALARVPLRVHSDLVVTTQMLVDPAEEVYLLPARTRYEQEGGGTETTTERRVVFSPEIPGHQVGEAMTEWRMFEALARAVAPERADLVSFADAAAVRAEIAEAVPAYRGIESLRERGDQFQWGGPHLCTGRRFPTPSGKARLEVPHPPRRPLRSLADGAPPAEAEFLLATRRGKQFNSMVQARRDPLTGAERDHVFVHPDDAAALGLAQDDPLELVNERGVFRGRAFPWDVARGTLQAFWPEVNPLLPPDRVDRGGGVPDYNAVVRIRRPAPRPVGA